MAKHIELIQENKPNLHLVRLFVGIDGKVWVADKFGTHRATAAAIALLGRPEFRVSGYREVEND